jgi:hypothetical protein
MLNDNAKDSGVVRGGGSGGSSRAIFVEVGGGGGGGGGSCAHPDGTVVTEEPSPFAGIKWPADLDPGVSRAVPLVRLEIYAEPGGRLRLEVVGDEPTVRRLVPALFGGDDVQR